MDLFKFKDQCSKDLFVPIFKVYMVRSVDFNLYYPGPSCSKLTVVN